MNAEAALSAVIYLISSALLLPTMILLIIAFAAAIVGLGGFLAEGMERARIGRVDTSTWWGLWEKPDAFAGLLTTESRKAYRRLQAEIDSSGSTRLRVEAVYEELRHRLLKRLDYLRLLVRVGPSLGLISTLIPMGTGLAALGQGDLARLSSDLVIAFTTTVVGLASGIVGYVLFTIRRRWLDRELAMLLAVAENASAHLPEDAPVRVADPILDAGEGASA